MKLKQWTKAILIGATVMTLAACHSARKPQDDSAINDANSAYNGAQASAMGDESGFGDQAGAGGRVLAKKVYYFDFDSNVVHDEDRPAIEANADRVAAKRNTKVMLEGHTDPRGSHEYNIGLGERRAKSVAEMMTSKGVSPSQIRIVSYGAEKLAAPGRTESDYQLDRRVVLVNTN